MGQKESKHKLSYYSTTDTQDYSMLKKAGSLSTLATYGKVHDRKGSIKRSRSFTDKIEEPGFVEKLRERVEAEAKLLNEWVHEARVKHPASLISLSSLVVASSLKISLDIERLPCKRELKKQIEFMMLPVFDEPIADQSVIFSNGGHTISYNGKSYSTTVLSTPQDKGIQSSRHAWIYYIENSRVQGWMQIGVVDKARWLEKCKTVWDGNPHPYRKGEIARRSNGNFHSGRDAAEATIARDSIFLGGYGRGDTIGVKLDCDNNEICWTRNGEAYGKPVSISSGPLWPSVSLDSPGEAVSLIYYTCSVRSVMYRKEYSNSIDNKRNNAICSDAINFKPIHTHPAIFKKHATIDRF